jgi:hypothetical protein
MRNKSAGRSPVSCRYILQTRSVHSTQNISEPEVRHGKRGEADEEWKRDTRRDWVLSVCYRLAACLSLPVPRYAIQPTFVSATVSGARRYFNASVQSYTLCIITWATGDMKIPSVLINGA